MRLSFLYFEQNFNKVRSIFQREANEKTNFTRREKIDFAKIGKPLKNVEHFEKVMIEFYKRGFIQTSAIYILP